MDKFSGICYIIDSRWNKRLKTNKIDIEAKIVISAGFNPMEE